MKARLPIAIAQYDDRIRTRVASFGGEDEAPEIRSNTKHLEELAADKQSLSRPGNSLDR